MEESTRVCKECGRTLPVTMFSKNRYGALNVCSECVNKKRNMTNAKKSNAGKVAYHDPEFDGKTPREVQDILARAAKWLNNYGGFTCNVELRYEKTINLDIN